MKKNKVEFNHIKPHERIAGLFVVLAFVAALSLSLAVAIQKGWFASKASYYTHLPSASGLHQGTQVLLSGLRAGWVDSVEFKDAGKIEVKFSVFEKYRQYLTQGTELQVTRPHIVGEKVLELVTGNASAKVLPQGALIPSAGNTDLVDVLSGRLLGPVLDDIAHVAADFKTIADSFTEQGLDKKLLTTMAKMDSLVVNMSAMGKELARAGNSLNKSKRLDKLLGQTEVAIGNLNQILPHIAQDTPQLMQNLPDLIDKLSLLAGNLNQMAPTLKSIAPQLPATSRRAAEAIDESVVLMKAMQQLFFLDGKVKRIRAEEAKRDLEQNSSRHNAEQD